ncbi:Protein ssh4 [Ceratocystis lukuohia]|uniref:Protein ssh4 n=1 Tax=Ceratocystis lukuohia TaxID=2019550 RepID=A0ABR4MRY1_9PEZI
MPSSKSHQPTSQDVNSATTFMSSSQPPSQDYTAKSGPPPQQNPLQNFVPPPGPPPTHDSKGPSPAYVDYAPPNGPPPPAKEPEAWELAVPDTSLFPPPPAFFSGHDRSWTSNAEEVEANAGEDWCAQNPLQTDLAAPLYVSKVLQSRNYALRTPLSVSQAQHGLTGTSSASQAINTDTGVWSLKTTKSERDTSWVAMPPVYSAELASTSQQPITTIYYEVKVNGPSGGGKPTVAIGYSALPYPDWRLPGWHRGSLAVHGDDGHRYINDRWGGMEFTKPFSQGETVGLGMRFERVPGEVTGPPKVTCFFTRNGRLDGVWDLNEEDDSEVSISRVGLQGHHDLCYVVGAYQVVDVEIIFDPSKWRCDPYALIL